MRRAKSSVLAALLSLLFISFLAAPVVAQKDKKTSTGPLMTRTMPRHETVRLPFGGTLTVSGAPLGSIIIEGWQRSEVDVTASIELQAPTAADLDLLASVNTFVVDEDSNHIRIMTTGTHDRAFMKRVKNFPKGLIGLPWKIDFRIRIPALTDLIIDAGTGPISLNGVEGALQLNALNSEANLTVTGGLVSVVVQTGKLNLRIPARGWRGLGAEFKMAAGQLTLELMPGFSADINASIVRFGEIKSTFADLQPRERNSISGRSMRARAGNGGATLDLTVGDGTIEIRQLGEGGKQ